MPVLRPGHQMGDRASGRIDNHPAHRAACPVGAAGAGPIVNGVVPAMAVLLVPRTLTRSESVLSLADQVIDRR